jgi:hypothetical protein
MPHRVVSVVSCAVALAAGAAAAAAAAAAHHAALLECRRGLEAADREATFEGRMVRVDGTSRMQLRFTLEARDGERRGWTAVAAPELGAWLTSDPGVGRYVFTRRVRDLPAGATYRALVHFRWLDAGGNVLLRRRAASRACRQPDLRPDLRPGEPWVASAPDGTARYLLPVGNRGRSPAGPFAVLVTIDGRPLPVASVPGLPARDERLVAVDGPPCAPGAVVSLRVDADGEVDERDENDNARERQCPLAAHERPWNGRLHSMTR